MYRNFFFIGIFLGFISLLGFLPPFYFFLNNLPVTAQSLGPLMIGGILGPKRACLVMLMFTILVFSGAPLVAGSTSGMNMLQDPMCGFFLSWLPVTYIVGRFIESYWDDLTILQSFLPCLLGCLLIDFVGIAWLLITTPSGFGMLAKYLSVFLIVDLVKALLASYNIITFRYNYPLLTATNDNF